MISDAGISAWRYPPSLADVDVDVAERNFGTAYCLLHEHHARKAGKEMWVSKTIYSVLCLNRVYRDFPQAKYINCIRDGRDVVLSLLENDFGPTNLIDAAYYWDKHIKAWEDAITYIPSEQIFTVHYEDLLTSPKKVICSLLDFIGLPFHQDCVNYHQSKRAREISVLPEHSNLAKSPDVTMIGKSFRRFSHEQIERIEAIAGKSLTNWNYSLRMEKQSKVVPQKSSWIGRILHTHRLLWNMATTKNKLRRASFLQRHYRKIRYSIWPI